MEEGRNTGNKEQNPMNDPREKVAGFYQEALEKIHGTWAKLTQDDPNFSAAAKARALMALVALCSFMMPWVQLDGYNEAMKGSELLAFAFTSPERGAMVRTAPLGAIALLFTPFVLAISSIYSFFKNLEGQDTMGSSILGAALPIVMLFLAQTLTGNSTTRIIGISMPHLGIITMVLCNAGLILRSIQSGRNRRT